MNYTEFATVLQQLLNLSDAPGIALVNSLMPRIVEATELRILREPEFDFLAARADDITQRTTTGLRSVQIPLQFLVVEGAALVLPSLTTPANGTRIQMTRADRPFIDMTWPQESATKAPDQINPTYFAIYSQFVAAPSDPSEPTALPSSILIGPTPDAEYIVEFTGVVRPAPLSPQVATNFLSTWMPDLYIASAMIFASGGVLRNYGLQAGDPQQAVSWTAVYQSLKSGIAMESLRQKSVAERFSTLPPNPTAPNVAQLQQMAQQAQPNGG